jgi:hypothetical protein
VRATFVSRSLWLVGVAVLLVPVAAAAAGPFDFYAITPCRVADTRNPAGPTGGPALIAFQERQFPVRGTCGVPASAQAVAINVTVVTPGDGGWLTVYPAGVARPFVSTVNFEDDDFAIANAATVALGSTADLALWWASFSGVAHPAHVVIDVSGYYE